MPPPKPAAPLQRKPLPPRPPSLVGEGIVTLSSISDAIVRSIAAYKVIAEVDVLLHSSIDRTLLFPLASDMREYSRQVQVPRARSIYHEMRQTDLDRGWFDKAAKKAFEKHRAEYVRAEAALQRERSKPLLDIIKLFQV